MRGTSLKLSRLVVVVLAIASFLSPFMVEASDKHTNHKNCNHNGKHPPISLLQAPTPAPPSQAPTPAPTPQALTPAPTPQAPIPALTPAPDVGAPPYQIDGCGYRPCSDYNDCDWPCTICGPDNTCLSHDETFLPPPRGEGPAPYPEQGGCDWPCSDSNDCDAPCTVCGRNNVCVYEEVCGYPCEDSSDCIIEPCVECCTECCPDKLCCKKQQAWPPMF